MRKSQLFAVKRLAYSDQLECANLAAVARRISASLDRNTRIRWARTRSSRRYPGVAPSCLPAASWVDLCGPRLPHDAINCTVTCTYEGMRNRRKIVSHVNLPSDPRGPPATNAILFKIVDMCTRIPGAGIPRACCRRWLTLTSTSEFTN